MPLLELRRVFTTAAEENLQLAGDLLRSFDELVTIRCMGLEMRLPNRNSIWRGLQVWGLMTGQVEIDFSKFCLAGNCKRCATTIRWAGADGPETVLACQTEPRPGMEILQLPEGFRIIT